MQLTGRRLLFLDAILESGFTLENDGQRESPPEFNSL